MQEPLDYIEATGSQYIDTGVNAETGLKARVDFVGGERCEIITDMTDPDSLELYQGGVKTFSEEDLETFKTNGVVNLHLNLFVFACNLSGAPTWYSQGKLYELKLWKKNAVSGELDLVRHCLPCAKGGRAGLYDEVEGKIYYSFGDDNFIAGTVTNAPSLTDPEGNAIEDHEVIAWNEHYGATQENIDAFDSNFETGNAIVIDYELPASAPPAFFEAVVE